MARSMLTRLTIRRIVSRPNILVGTLADALISALRYIPTTPAAIAFGSLYLATIGAFVVLSIRRWGRYMLVLMISGVIYAAGLFLRICK